MKLNRLVILEELVSYIPNNKFTYLLIKHNFPGFNDKKRDLAYDVIDSNLEVDETVIEDDYLIPFLDYSGKEIQQICKDVIPSAFSSKSFSRYYIKVRSDEDPVLVEPQFPRTPRLTMPILPMGSVEYDVINFSKIKDLNYVAWKAVEALKSEKEELKHLFYAG